MKSDFLMPAPPAISGNDINLMPSTRQRATDLPAIGLKASVNGGGGDIVESNFHGSTRLSAR